MLLVEFLRHIQLFSSYNFYDHMFLKYHNFLLNFKYILVNEISKKIFQIFISHNVAVIFKKNLIYIKVIKK